MINNKEIKSTTRINFDRFELNEIDLERLGFGKLDLTFGTLDYAHLKGFNLDLAIKNILMILHDSSLRDPLNTAKRRYSNVIRILSHCKGETGALDKFAGIASEVIDYALHTQIQHPNVLSNIAKVIVYEDITYSIQAGGMVSLFNMKLA